MVNLFVFNALPENLFDFMMFFFLDPPSVTTQPSDKTVIENEEATLHCKAIGNPVPEIIWLKDGDIVGSGETLNIGALRRHSGKYWCSADNGLGAPVNASANLDVQCK